MATEDRSRSAFYPGKHYAGVRMQQGRVLTDDDYNEGSQILEADHRTARVDVIGPHGSPDQGFLVLDPRFRDSGIDFTIRSGTYYIGGLRVEIGGLRVGLEPTPPRSVELSMPGAIEGPPPPHPAEIPAYSGRGGQAFSHQTDWLGNPGVDAPTQPRIDLVYLEAWQQPVSAVEDEELFETALGGPDTSTRVRTMARVKVLPDIESEDCHQAWVEAVTHLADQGGGRLEPTSHELVTDARLTIDFEPLEGEGDLCSPRRAAGYLGAENQAIRVQLLGDGNAFTWGLDNGAPLYRVEVVNPAETVGDTTVTRLRMRTAPKDVHHWPAAGQIVEVLPWGAVLPNGEKLAEELEPAGHLCQVWGDYDPDSGELMLTPPLDDPDHPSFGMDWTGRTDAAALRRSRFGARDTGEYLFLRIWDRGSDRESPPAVAVPEDGASVSLGNTGLTVAFGGESRRAGDYWIIAARPQTPDEIIPWELRAGRASDGMRHFCAPLALIRWDGSPDRHMGGVIQDCRKTFRPLTEIQSCCYTVGDGTHSHGDFASIQEALSHLRHLGTRGEVCVLPGSYEEHLELSGLQHVTIRGCGFLSRLRAPGVENGRPVISIADCSHIEVSSLAVDASTRQIAIELLGQRTGGTGDEGQQPTVNHVRLSNLDISTRGRSAIMARGCDQLAVTNNRILLKGLKTALDEDPTTGQEPAIFVAVAGLPWQRHRSGYGVLIKGNRIGPNENLDWRHTPRGGIQIAGGSFEVKILENEIFGGTGDGITLGSVSYVPAQVADSEEALETHYATNTPGPYGSYAVFVDENGCIRFGGEPPPPQDDAGSAMVPVSDGFLVDVDIIGNRIENMGGNGIGVAQFLHAQADRGSTGVFYLTIKGNRIRRCLSLGLAPISDAMYDLWAFGGIALADVGTPTIRDNLIEKNGTERGAAVCGIFIQQTHQYLDIERNKIVNNGGNPEANVALLSGQRGGIVIGFARGSGTDAFAARIHDNPVVAPNGRALQLVALGPVSVRDNHFTSRGEASQEQTTRPTDMILYDLAESLAAGDTLTKFMDRCQREAYPQIAQIYANY